MISHLARNLVLLGALLLLGGARSSWAQTAPASIVQPFQHRSYLGWIRDLASVPRPNDRWPSIVIDEGLLRDYDQTFAWMQKAGFNEIVLWGLFTDRNWEPDVEKTIDAQRAAQIRALLDGAHRHGLKVLYGGGLYSWGFEKIIAAHPELGRGDARNMSPAVPGAWLYQKRILDFIFSFPFDGCSLQSADLGRNPDPELQSLSDLEYHALVNERAARYIKQTYPGKIVGVSGWGMNFSNRADLPAILQLTRYLDYLVDVQDTAHAWRADLVRAIKPCAFGSTASPNLEPPSHWERDRWFLPITHRMATLLEELARDGGRAVETYMRTRANPGDEMSIEVAARVLRRPTIGWKDALRASVDELYRPKTEAARERLVALFERAEDAYYANAHVGPAEIIRVEPLEGDAPGPPIYLRDRMNAGELDAYAKELTALRDEAKALETQVGDSARVRLIERCLGHALDDVASVRKEK